MCFDKAALNYIIITNIRLRAFSCNAAMLNFERTELYHIALEYINESQKFLPMNRNMIRNCENGIRDTGHRQNVDI